MSVPISLYKSDIDEYADYTFLDRIIHGIGNKQSFSTFVSLATPVDAPRMALINRCRERYKIIDSSGKLRKLFWISPFNAWDLLSIGNLSLALLWHIYKSLPETIISDEKIIYKLGKISVSLPAITDIFRTMNSNPCETSGNYTSLMNNVISPEKKSSVSSIFSVCEQITELAEAFNNIGKQISINGNFDSLVIPIVDIDLCTPDQTISLIFAIKNFICCDHFAFIIVADSNLVANALNATYNHSLLKEQSKKIINSLFDDRVNLPPPSLENILRSLDNKIITKEKDRIISLINKSGILALLTDHSIIQNCFHRYRLFINNMPDKFSADEYAISALLFLIGTCIPESLQKLATFPDLHLFIAKLRTIMNTQNTTPISQNYIQTTSKHYVDFPLSYFEIIYKDNKLLSSFFSILPKTISDSQVAKLMIKIISFI